MDRPSAYSSIGAIKPLAPGLHKMGASKFYAFGMILFILASTLISVFKILHFIEALKTFVHKSVLLYCMESESKLVLRPKKISTIVRGPQGLPWQRASQQLEKALDRPIDKVRYRSSLPELNKSWVHTCVLTTLIFYVLLTIKLFMKFQQLNVIFWLFATLIFALYLWVYHYYDNKYI